MQFLRSRWFYFWIAIIGLPLAWWYWGTGWVAEKRWQAYLAESRARGVRWDEVDFRLPTVAAEDDLLQLPMLTDRMKWKELLESVEIRVNGRSTEETMRSMNWRKILEDIHGSKRAATIAEKDVLSACEEALRPLQGVVDHLTSSRAASANWPPEWGYYLDTSGNDVMTRCIQVLWLRGQLDLALDRPQAARKTFDALMRITSAHQKAPSVSKHYVAWESIRMARHFVVEGLSSGRLTDDLLRHFLEEYSKTDHIRILVWQLCWQRASFREALEESIGDVASMLGSPYRGAESLIRDLGLRMSMSRREWWRTKQIRLEESREELLSMIDFQHQRWVPRQRTFVPENHKSSAYDFDVNEAYRCWETARRAIFDQVQDRLAALACGLELYRRKTGAHPHSLEQLVPDFLPKLPDDPASGRPFIYRRQDDGSFLLYSVGFNGIDQGGSSVRSARQVEKEQDWRWLGLPIKSKATAP